MAASSNSETCTGSSCFRTAMCILSGICAFAVVFCVILTRRAVALNAKNEDVLPATSKRMPEPEPENDLDLHEVVV